MATATNIELSLYRSGLLRAGVNARLEVSCMGTHKVRYTWYA